MNRILASSLLFFTLVGCASSQTGETPLTRIAFASCVDQKQPEPIASTLFDAHPELFVFLGDNIYADNDLDLKKAAYAKLAQSANFQRLRNSSRILATWDDHDFGGNDGGADYAHREASQQLFLDFFQEPQDSPRWKRPGVYHTYTFGPEGKRVQIILLDTRYFRSPLNVAADPKSTLLNSEQWMWLEAQLLRPADLRLIVSSIQVLNEDPSGEKWFRFPHQRARLFKLLADTKANGVLFLSGDRHFAELSSIKEGPVPYRLYDLTSSAMSAKPAASGRDRPNRNRVGEYHLVNNFGLVLIDWEKRVVTIEARHVDGKPLITRAIPLTELQN